LTPCRGRANLSSVTALKTDDTLLSNNHRRLKSGYPPHLRIGGILLEIVRFS
jgi:hypothetical protein